MQVNAEKFSVPKVTRYGTVEKSTGLEAVTVFNEATEQWVHCGYVHTAQNVMTGLVDLDPDLGKEIAAALSEKKGFTITYGGAAQSFAQQNRESVDELIGEAEEQDTED